MKLDHDTKILMFDIETTNLNANFGFILCIGYKFLHQSKIGMISIDDYDEYESNRTNDKNVVRAFAEVYNSADVVVSWYGTRFDTPYINSRLLYHGLAPMARVPHVDGWRTARNHLKLNSNRLQTVAEYFNVSSKTAVSGPHWVNAMAGKASALKYVKKHCCEDIVTLENVYKKLLPLMCSHPNVNLVNEEENRCPRCGSGNLQKRGFNFAQTSKSRRYWCKNCKGWSRGRPERVPGFHVR